MALATLCFGAERREWSAAMEAEFEIAALEGPSFAFASGCLIAAWRDMPLGGSQRSRHLEIGRSRTGGKPDALRFASV